MDRYEEVLKIWGKSKLPEGDYDEVKVSFDIEEGDRRGCDTCDYGRDYAKNVTTIVGRTKKPYRYEYITINIDFADLIKELFEVANA